jgi:uncharacterized protein YkwD
VNVFRRLPIAPVLILVCMSVGAVLADGAAARSVTARPHRACRAVTRHHRRREHGIHAGCRSHAAHYIASHTARNRSARTRADRRRHALPPATAPAASSSSSASVIASVLATPCQDTELTPEPGNLAEVDAATLCLINQERARDGEQPLVANPQLQQAAQSHSEEMVTDDYFAHVSPSGLTPVERVQRTGYIPSSQDGYTLGENIAWGTLQLSTPASIVAAWIASPEHLANILYAAYRDTGLAVVASAPPSLGEGQPGAVYSQEFGVIVP